MGCGVSQPYSQIGPEGDDEDSVYSLHLAGDVIDESLSLEWQQQVLARPQAARENTFARSPKEALALDMFLFIKNLQIKLTHQTNNPTAEENNTSSSRHEERMRACQLMDLLTYHIEEQSEIKAGAVDGIGETYRPQRQQLLT